MLARKQRKMMIIVSSIIITLLIIIGILSVLFIKTDMLMQNSKMFIKYTGENLQKIEEIVEFKKTKINEEIEKNKYKTNTNIKVEYVDDEKKEENTINKAKIKSEGLIDKKEEYIYENIQLNYEEEKIGRIEYIKNNEISGVKVDGLNQFTTKRNEENEKIQQIEKIANIKDYIKFTENEKKIITSTYLSIIEKNTTKENYKKIKNKTIKINDKNVKTKGYSLVLDKEKYNAIIIKILERIINDEVLLGKFDKIQSNMSSNERLKEINLRKDFIEKVEKEIEKIKNTNIGQEKIEINTYVKDKKALKTEIKTPEYEIEIERIEKNEIRIKYKKIYDNKTKEKNIIIKDDCIEGKEERKIDYYEIDDNIEEKRILIEDVKRKENEKIKQELNITYKLEENIGKIKLERELNQVEEIDKEEIIKDQNIILDDIEKEKAKAIEELIEKRINKQIETILEKIKLDDINYMLKKLEILKETELQFNEEDKEIVTEAERNRFNSNLTFYIGKEIDVNTLKQLIETIKNDTKNIQIKYEEEKNKKELKGFIIDLKRNTKNEEEIQKMINALDENEKEKFTVAMSYDQDTKLINKITIVSNKYTKK